MYPGKAKTTKENKEGEAYTSMPDRETNHLIHGCGIYLGHKEQNTQGAVLSHSSLIKTHVDILEVTSR